MNRILVILLSIILCFFCLFGCRIKGRELSETDDSTKTAAGSSCVRIYDRFHPDYNYEKDAIFSTTVGTVPHIVRVARKNKDGFVYINEKKLNEYFQDVDLFYDCDSFYISDLTGDGYPELCFGHSIGSGIANNYIHIIDYTLEKVVLTLSDRMNYDYFLFKRNGDLCVKETDFDTKEVTRTGVLVYNGTEVVVAWDSEIDTKTDR